MAAIDLVVESGDALDVRHFVIVEAASDLFVIDVLARADSPNVDLEFVVGRPASLRIDAGTGTGALGGVRYHTGIVSRVELEKGVEVSAKEQSTYRVRIVPEAYKLSLRTNYRIYQDRTVPSIVQAIFDEWRVPCTFTIDHSAYPTVEYRVQHGESDLDFARRLLEEEGITFTFPEDAKGSVITFADRLHAAPPRAGSPIAYFHEPSVAKGEEFLTHARWSSEVRPAGAMLRDFEFRNPDVPVQGSARAATADQRLERYEARPGGFVVKTEGASDTKMADSRGRYRHDELEGLRQAGLLLDALRTGRRSFTFEINTVDMHPGMVFTVADHPEVPPDLPLLCTEMRIEGKPGEKWVQTGRAVAADVPYRPPLRTPKPRAPGFVSAIVVGPAKTEILTDEYGRVRVQLPWDRYGTSDEKSSCFLRVSHGWAGPGYGLFAMPRIGQEVLVSFLDGDPDMPVLVGRVHNRTNPVPYRLPDMKTRSTDRSDSSVGSTGQNELLFEDAASKELVYLQAQKNLRHLVQHDETITVGVNRDKLVRSNETETTALTRTQVTNDRRFATTSGHVTTSSEEDHNELTEGDSVKRIEEEALVLVEGDRHVLVKGTDRQIASLASHVQVAGDRRVKTGAFSLAVGGESHVSSGGVYKMCSKDDAHVKTSTDFVGEAPDITLKGPGGFLRIDASGVTISGVLVKVNAGGSPGSGAAAGPAKPELPKDALVEAPPAPPPPAVLPPDAEFPPGPEVPVRVSIKADNGIKGGCLFVPKGKTHKYTAVGSPEGGTYRWTASGNVTIVGSATDATVEVRGGAVSGAVGDSELSVEYAAAAGKAKDAIKLTVFEISKIEARLAKTPCLHGGTGAGLSGAKSSTKDDKTIDRSAVTVVRGSGDLKLTAVVKPDGVPVTWFVERAADDAAALTGTPTHVLDGPPEKRTLRTDATGSFHVHAFVDCDGDGKRGPDETGLLLNVNMVQVEVVPGAANNRQFKRNGLFTSGRSGGGFLIVDSGTPAWPLAAHNAVYNDSVFSSHAQAVKAVIKLTGGGAQQRRGLREVQAGIVRVSTGDTFRGTYADGRTLKEVTVRDPATPDPIVAGAPALLRYPVRDCRGATGKGLDTFGTSSSDADRKDLPDGGQRRVVRNIDSPAIALNLTHPVTGSALASISGYNAFACVLTVYSTDFDETFTVLGVSHWKAVYGTYSAAGGWTSANARITGDRAMKVFHPPKKGEDVPELERCPPNFVFNLRMDAR